MKTRLYGGPYDGQEIEIVEAVRALRLLHPVEEALSYDAPPRPPRFPLFRPWRLLSYFAERREYAQVLATYDSTLAEPCGIVASQYDRHVWTHRVSPLVVIDEVFYVHESLSGEALATINPCSLGCCR